MKECPNCKAEIEESFEICWNCNYSLTEKQFVEFEDPFENKRDLDCLRCQIPLVFTGNYKFHEGARLGILGNLLEAFVNRESFDLYICPKCGKVEFYSPRTT